MTLWAPISAKQWLAYFSLADELYYGGAAGGGKTDLILGLAINEHNKSIIFRRVYPQFKEIRYRSRQLLRKHAYWNGTYQTWTFPDDRFLEFGACQYEDDKENYQGRPHDLKSFDEITQFTKTQFDYLKGWRRTEIPGQRTRVVCTGNPPLNKGQSWVVDYWGPWLNNRYPKPARPGELRFFAKLDDKDVEVDSGDVILHKGEKIIPISRTFIPATVKDNPFYRGTAYEAVLQNLPEPLKSALYEGRFDITVEDDPFQAIPSTWVEEAMERGKKISKPSLIELTALGVDVARGGQDQTIIAPRYGPWFDRLVKLPGHTTPKGQDVAAQVIKYCSKNASVNIDVIGIGSSVYDILTETKLKTFAINSSAGSNAADKTGKFGFLNLRAEMWWKLRESLDPQSGNEVCLPDDPELLADLTAPRYSLTVSGIKIESKEDVKKRLGRSPDCGDAVVYANYTGQEWGVFV